ncbi:glycosyltransferase family 4 protein, partial [Halobacillus sp. BBL2006]|uniref:glycosyltransferase family 4 protein n=1 Tax=Halobacillus sp. BBL2006 TaxID=1543706 RepID=UPI000542ECB1
MKKQTVLHVGPLPPPIGGISVFISQLKKFTSDHYDLQFFNIFPKKNKRLNKLVYNMIVLFKFFFVLKSMNPALVHIHTAGFKAFTKSRFFLLIAKALNYPVIMHVHSGKFFDFYANSTPKKKQMIEDTLARADKIVCLSPIWKKQFLETFDVPEERYEIVTNAIFTNEFKDVQPVFPEDKKTVLFVGKLGANKGVRDIIAMAKKLKDDPTIDFKLMGSGPLEKELQQEIETNDLNIQLLGTMSGKEKVEQFEQAQLFILPSYFEALGLSNLEGMAAGLVVLSTNVGAVPDIIHQDEEGYLFEPGDVDRFVEKIVSLDPETMKRISNHNKKQAKAYDFSNLNDRL